MRKACLEFGRIWIIEEWWCDNKLFYTTENKCDRSENDDNKISNIWTIMSNVITIEIWTMLQNLCWIISFSHNWLTTNKSKVVTDSYKLFRIITLLNFVRINENRIWSRINVRISQIKYVWCCISCNTLWLPKSNWRNEICTILINYAITL